MDLVKQNFEKIVSVAKSDGARVEMLINSGENLKITFQKKKLESYESTQSQTAGLRVILGRNQGYAFTENLAAESLLRTYQEALANAKTVQKGEGDDVPMMVPDAKMKSNSEKESKLAGPFRDLFRQEQIPIEKKMLVAQILEEVPLTVDSRIQSVPTAMFRESLSVKRILNSEGLDQEFKQSSYSGAAAALAKDSDSTKMDWDSFFVRSFEDIHAEETAKKAATKAVARLGAKKLSTGRYAVVIDRDQFATVLAMISSYFSAEEVHKGKSLFLGKLGQKLGSDKFQLCDDPFYSSGGGVRPFDDEGAPSEKVSLFEDGVLKNFLTNLEYAKKMKLPHTAHASRSPTSEMQIAPSNLVVQKGTTPLKELLASHDQVLHLTHFTGGLHAGFTETTGDFSMPAEGFLYQKGLLVGPVDQFVVSGNVLDLLRDIEDLGNQYGRPGHSMVSPDVLIKSLSFAGG